MYLRIINTFTPLLPAVVFRKMNIIKYSLLLFFCCLISENIFPQGSFQEFDNRYGLDPQVFNGRKYSYFLPSGTGGHQYWLSQEFAEGFLEMRGKGDGETGRKGEEEKGRYREVYFLNYDVYNQKVLLKFEDESGAVQIIEMPDSRLDGFSLGDARFEILPYEEQDRIFQVLGNDKYKILIYCRKDLKLSNSTGYATYSFSLPLKTRYVLTEDRIRQFGSKGSFIKIFDPSVKPLINNYLKDKKISLKQASDRELSDLIDYISKLK